MNFDIEELKIQFYTNIRTKGQQTVEFKRSLLFHPELQITDDLSDYPFFTFDVEYPLNRLRYLTYQDRVEFFFNKQKFIERLDAYSDKRYILKKSTISDEDEYYKRRDKNIQHNIMTMLEILFPTKFPVINDLRTSFEHVFDESTVQHMILNPIIEKHFSYLTVNGQIYTFKKVIWLNDLLNHPMYRRLINEYRKFWVWANEEKSRWTKVIKQSYPKLKPNMEKKLVKLFEYIKTQILENEDDIIKLDKSIFVFLDNFLKLYILSGYSIKNATDNIDLLNEFLNDLVANKETELLKVKSEIDELKKQLAVLEKDETIKEEEYQDYADSINRISGWSNSAPALKLRTEKKNIKNEINKLQRDINKKEKFFRSLQQQKDDRYNIVQDEIIEVLLSIEKYKLPTDLLEKSNEIVRVFKKIRDDTTDTDEAKQLKQLMKFDNPLEVPVDKLRKVSDLFVKPLSVIQKEQNPLSPEYRNFAYVILSEYRRPQRESTNVSLQDMINGFDEKSVQDFFEFFEKIYDVYMIGQGNKFKSGEETRYKSLLNVGMSYINTNVSKGVRREVYVLADFIEGEINKDNVGSIYCPFIGDHLGNEFEFLVRMAQYGKVGKDDRNRWAVDRNRMIFSLKQLQSAKSAELGKTVEMVATTVGMPPNAAKNFSETLIVPQEQSGKRENQERLNTLFLSRIVADDESIKMAFTDINQYDQTLQLYDLNLLEYLQKNAKELYSLIEEWNEKEQQRDNKVLDKLIKLKSSYKGQIEAFEQQLKNYEVNTDNVKKNKINFEIAKYELFIAVTDKLIKIEQGKVERVVVGGRRSHRKKSLSNKKRHLTRRHR